MMQTIKPYTTYKPSGIAWLGDIPEHWEKWKISRGVLKIGSGTTPSSGNKDFYENGTINWLNTGDFNDGILYECKKKVTPKAIQENSALKLFPKGTLSIAMYGATIGKVCIIQFDATTNQACCNIEEGNVFSNKFLMYWFIGHRPHIVNLSYGGGQPNISQDVIKSLYVPSPNKSEQQKIANFLDYKTAKIDRFIAKKKQLIKLLNEQKAGIINDAVAKGLNPNTKTKPSGIEWLGDIPEHWEVRKLKYSVSLNQHSVFDDGEKNINKIALENIESKTGRILQTEEISFEGVGTIFKKGDVLFGKLRPYLAKVISPNFEGSCVNEILVLTPNKNIWATEFLKFRMLSSEFIKIVDDSTFGSKMPRASWNFIGGLKISCPPIHEQTAIVSYIEAETAIINKTITTIEKEIALVQEYRTAIIAEAVTGKIDVRDYCLNQDISGLEDEQDFDLVDENEEESTIEINEVDEN